MNSESALKSRRGCSTLPPAELDRFKTVLSRQYSLLHTYLERLSESGLKTSGEISGLSTVPGHLAELASETFEQELSLDILERTQEELRNIADALERIENRSYGLCNDCGQMISIARLEAMPAAEFCIDCKSRIEQL